MPQFPHETMELNPLIPAAPWAQTWTRFVYHFEPAEFTNWIDESESWKHTAYVGDWSARVLVTQSALRD